MPEKPQALNVPLEEFLRPFFDASDTVCLRIFDDKKTAGTSGASIFKGMKLECEAGKISTLVDTLHRHNAHGRGIYFVINYGGHEDATITRINAQFVECDDLPIEEQLKRIDAFPLPPSVVVRTKKSLHTYWLVKGAKVEDFRRVQKKLITHFEGDPACVNESRVFRLPGFNHCKGEPVPVTCIRFNPEHRYTQAQLEEVLPALPEEGHTAASLLKGTRNGLTLVGKRCLFIQHCKENAATLPEANWYAMISNLAVFEGGEAAIHALSKAYPKYTRNETERKIQHFLKSGTKPMTCRKIAEVGFSCPRLGEEECACKSPAALCFLPMRVEELRESLAAQTVKHVAVDDLQTAQMFVAEYLYNIEQVLGEAFIMYEIKSHFGLKTSDMRGLIALYRESRKRFMEHKETKREAMREEVAPWYEPTERGGLRFMSGILADHMAKTIDAFYGAGSFFFYEHGVYVTKNDLDASAKAREFMLPRYASMMAISDTTGQWKMLIRMPVREINRAVFKLFCKAPSATGAE